MPLKPGGARLKGQRHEREVSAAFNKQIPGLDAKRGVGQSRGGGAEVPDVVIPLLHLECKWRKEISIWAAHKQAQHDAKDGKIPAVIVKQNHRPNMVVMELSDFTKLFGEFLKWKEGNPETTVSELQDKLDTIETNIAMDSIGLESRHKRVLPPPHPKAKL